MAAKEIKLKSTKLQKACNVLCILLLAGMVLNLAVSWGRLPDKIPGHYNGAGAVDRWGGKGELIVLPVISFLLYGFISLLERYPQIWNTGVRITDANRNKVYGSLKNMVVITKLVMVAVFSYISFSSVHQRNLGGWFLPVSLLAMFVPMAYYMIKIYRIPK